MTTKIKILFIDDDITYGNLVMLTLNHLGYEAYYQSSLTAIEHAIQEIKPNILILDVEIGNRISIDSVAEIQKNKYCPPIIFISSHTDSSTVVKALNNGGVAYLKKPFETEELIAHINRHASATITDSKSFELGNYSLDTVEKTILYNNKLVKQLSIIEYHIIELLFDNANSIVTRENIINNVCQTNTPANIA